MVFGARQELLENPDYFKTNSNPSINMIRQILGSVSEFQKSELVLKLKVSRDRKKLVNEVVGIKTLSGTGKCEGRKSHIEKNPELIKQIKRLRRLNRVTGKRKSYRLIANELFNMGFANLKGNSFQAIQIQRIFEGSK